MEPSTSDRQDAGARPAPEAEESAGGDPACWAHLVCQECGAVVSGASGAGGHRPGCRSGPPPGRTEA